MLRKVIENRVNTSGADEDDKVCTLYIVRPRLLGQVRLRAVRASVPQVVSKAAGQVGGHSDQVHQGGGL
jgi:hypothetical protein